MQIKCDIVWKRTGDLALMKQHLVPHNTSKDRALNAIYGWATPEQRGKTPISLRFQISPSESYFIFVEGAGSTSQIVGVSESNRMDHLLYDFKHLIYQMKSSSIQFKIKSTYIQTNDERFVKKSLKRYVAEKGVLLNLVSLAGIVPAISAYIKNPIPLTWDVSVFYPVPIGFIFWLIIVSLGYRGAAQYGLE